MGGGKAGAAAQTAVTNGSTQQAVRATRMTDALVLPHKLLPVLPQVDVGSCGLESVPYSALLELTAAVEEPAAQTLANLSRALLLRAIDKF